MDWKDNRRLTIKKISSSPLVDDLKTRQRNKTNTIKNVKEPLRKSFLYGPPNTTAIMKKLAKKVSLAMNQSQKKQQQQYT